MIDVALTKLRQGVSSSSPDASATVMSSSSSSESPSGGKQHLVLHSSIVRGRAVERCLRYVYFNLDVLFNQLNSKM